MTQKGPVFVTETNNWERTARWDKDKKPMDFTKGDAEFLAPALTINGNLAFTVVSNYKIEHQPYNYEDYSIVFRKKGKKKDDNKRDDK
jgi:hypothetical protein